MKKETNPKRLTRKTMFFEQDKLPPQAIDIECAIMASILTYSNSHAEIFELLTPEIFYKEEHGRVFEVAAALYTKNLPVDFLSVVYQLKITEQLEMVGGTYAIEQYKKIIITPSATEFNCRILLQKFLQREIIRIGYENANEAYEEAVDVFDLHDKFNQELELSLQTVLKGRGAASMPSLTNDAIERYNKRKEAARENKITGISTGLTDLNKITGGWQKTDLIIIAGRPSQGKTACALHFALSSNKKCLVFSLEMGENQLADRLMVSVGDFDAGKYRDGYLSHEEEKRLYTAKAELDKKGIYLDDTPAIRIREIRAKAKKEKRLHGIELILIDYIQLTDAEQDSRGNREQDISGISRGLKKLAKELDIPVIALSQLSRKCEERADKRPMLSDLRESGAIEQDADIVIFVYRPEFYGMKDESGNLITGTGKLIISKHRNGKTTELPFRYNESLTKIYDYDNRTTAITGYSGNENPGF